MMLVNSEATHLLHTSPIFQKAHPALIHQVVNTYLAGGHQRTKKQKNRAEVSGGNSKPWPQKGRGLARAGSIRSPLFRKGGVTFAATGLPRRVLKINRRMYRGGMKGILAELLAAQQLQVIHPLVLPDCKTKSFLKLYNDTHKTLFLLDPQNISPDLLLAVRNLSYITVTTPLQLHPVALLKHERLFIEAGALTLLEQRLQ
jgi:large subunit ribosomal protein L4